MSIDFFLHYTVSVLLCFLLWTFCSYWIHRCAHIHSHKNPLWLVHVAHHRIPYFKVQPVRKPALGQYFFWLGDLLTSLDVIMALTLPIVVITFIWPEYGIPLLIFHYFYEVYLSEGVLDHNGRLTGNITRYFAWGSYHLYHHADLNKNYGLMITLWDKVFGTYVFPEENFLAEKVKY